MGYGIDGKPQTLCGVNYLEHNQHFYEYALPYVFLLNTG